MSIDETRKRQGMTAAEDESEFAKLAAIIARYDYADRPIEDVKRLVMAPGTRESKIYAQLHDIYSNARHLSIRCSDGEADDRAHHLELKQADVNEGASSLAGYLSNSVTGMSVLIKPNLVSIGEYPETSSFETISKILGCVAPFASYTAIGDGPSLFFDSERAIARVRKEFPSVEVYDFNRSRFRQCSMHSWEAIKIIEVAEQVYDFDVIINLCNLKAHDSFEYSGAKKNLLGLVSPATRLMIHRLPGSKREKALDELACAFMPQTVIMDARSMMLNAQQKVYGGVPAKGPGMFFSADPVALDMKVKDYLGIGGN